MAAPRSLGVSLPDEGKARVNFDDSIVIDTAEEQQDMAEVATWLMGPAKYRAKWYGKSGGRPLNPLSRMSRNDI